MSPDPPIYRLATESGPAEAERWLTDHGDALYRFALLRLGTAAAAEDAVQDTLLAGLRAAAKFEGRSAERTWLIGILKHKIIDQMRRSRRERPVGAPAEVQSGPVAGFGTSGKWAAPPRSWPAAAVAGVESEEFHRAFIRCLRGLPQQAAARFSLREVEGLPNEEICKILELSSTNLWTLLHRARLQLRRCLEESWFRSGSA